jgi:hypothetical protein
LITYFWYISDPAVFGSEEPETAGFVPGYKISFDGKLASLNFFKTIEII